jgi:hypothetical protein
MCCFGVCLLSIPAANMLPPTAGLNRTCHRDDGQFIQFCCALCCHVNGFPCHICKPCCRRTHLDSRLSQISVRYRRKCGHYKGTKQPPVDSCITFSSVEGMNLATVLSDMPVFFLIPCRQMSKCSFKLGHNRFLSHPFQFIVL